MCERVKNLLNIKFDSSPGDSDDTYIKTKTKTNGDNVKYKFQSKRLPKEKTSCKCLSSMLKDFVVKEKKNDHPQTLLDG